MRTKITLLLALLVFGLVTVGTIRHAGAEPPGPCFDFGTDRCIE
jgi:hypothetical protein